MVRIVISVKASNAIPAILPLGNVFFERALTATGERYIWIEGSGSTSSPHCAALSATSSCGSSR